MSPVTTRGLGFFLCLGSLESLPFFDCLDDIVAGWMVESCGKVNSQYLRRIDRTTKPDSTHQ